MFANIFVSYMNNQQRGKLGQLDTYKMLAIQFINEEKKIFSN